MNKFTKASIATGAGIILLLGGAGTFAYWNDSASIAGGSITSGTLSFGGDTTGVWKLVKGAQVDAAPGSTETDDVTIANLAAFRIVPGDKLVYVVDDVVVNATGDNLKAVLDVDFGTATDTIDGATVTTHLRASATGFSESGGAIRVQPGAATAVNTGVYVLVDLPFGTAVDNDSQSSTLDLSEATLELTQVLDF
jgi:alternate signal-mediated exported protein